MKLFLTAVLALLAQPAVWAAEEAIPQKVSEAVAAAQNQSGVAVPAQVSEAVAAVQKQADAATPAKGSEAASAPQKQTEDAVSQTSVSSQPSAPKPADANVAPGQATIETDHEKLQDRKTPLLGSSTYPLPNPVAITVLISPGAEQEGITIVTMSRGFQVRSVFRSRELSGLKIAVEMFGEFSYFDDEPRITCKGMYSVQRAGKSDTYEFDVPNTFLKGSQPLLLHAKDGRRISVSVSKKLPEP